MASRAALPPPRLVSETYAAAYLGRGRSRFREEWRAGKAPAPSDRKGRVPLWDMRVLDSFVDAKSGIKEPVRNTWDDDLPE